MGGLEQVLSHRHPHIAEPDETDLRHGVLHLGFCSDPHAGCSRAAISASHRWAQTWLVCNHVQKARQIRVSRLSLVERGAPKSAQKCNKSPELERRVPNFLPNCSPP